MVSGVWLPRKSSAWTRTRPSRAAFAGEEGENLDELELVVEVVLEPQFDALEIAVGAQGGIALGELGGDLGRVDAEAVGEIGDPRGRARHRGGRRDRPLVQHVAPRQDGAVAAGKPEEFGGAVAVGEDQVGHPAKMGAAGPMLPGGNGGLLRSACKS